MAISSHAFGCVTLTKKDAAQFSRQVKYGRANAAAKSTVSRGLAMNTEFKSGGGKLKVKAVRRKKDAVVG
ncbi:MAG: hypothetical protein OXC26_10200 [Albidovulum sp.]|nr:hypothetical protein [Albidovulum sp.]